MLGPAVGWMLTGLPQMCPSVSEVLDRPLGVRLTGPGGGEWTLLPGEPLLTVVPGLQDPAATATSAAPTSSSGERRGRPGGSRSPSTGDGDYAVRVLDRIDIV